MLAFVVAVMHPDFSPDYSRVERLLERTLASVCRQKDPGFRVFVVGNQAPSFDLPERVEFVPVDFPPPSGGRGWDNPRARFDKGTKVAVGLLAARGHAPDHVMVVDADDFVSDRLAGFANRDPDANGWYLTEGYQYDDRYGVVKPHHDFYPECGTSMIINYRLYDIPDLPLSATQDELEAGYGTFCVYDLLANHQVHPEHFASMGTPLSTLPFPGAVYTFSTGQNWSDRALDGFGVPVGRRLAAEFGLPVSTTNPRALAHSAYGFARAVDRRVRRREPRKQSSGQPQA